MIIRGSASVSGPLSLVVSDASGQLAPLNLTGMTLAVRWWDVGHVGAWARGCWDYGHGPVVGDGPLLEVPQWDEVEEQYGVLVVSDAAAGRVWFSLTPGQANQLFCRSVVWQAGRRELVRQIWRIDSGYESMLREDVDWARS